MCICHQPLTTSYHIINNSSCGNPGMCMTWRKDFKDSPKHILANINFIEATGKHLPKRVGYNWEPREHNATPPGSTCSLTPRAKHFRNSGANAIDNIKKLILHVIQQLICYLGIRIELVKARLHQRPTGGALVEDAILEPKFEITLPDRAASI